MARAAAQFVRVAAGPRSDMLGFVTIFAAALAGLAGLGAWAVGASAIALASLSYAEHYQLYRRGQELGLTFCETRCCAALATHSLRPVARTLVVSCCA
jgi:hypothetical protein